MSTKPPGNMNPCQIAFWSRTRGQGIWVTYFDGSAQWLVRVRDGFYASVPVHVSKLTK